MPDKTNDDMEDSSSHKKPNMGELVIKVASEKAEAERIAAEMDKTDKTEAESVDVEKLKSEQVASEKAEAEKLAADNAETEKTEAKKSNYEEIADKKAEIEKVSDQGQYVKDPGKQVASQKAEAKKIAAEKATWGRRTMVAVQEKAGMHRLSSPAVSKLGGGGTLPPSTPAIASLSTAGMPVLGNQSITTHNADMMYCVPCSLVYPDKLCSQRTGGLHCRQFIEVLIHKHEPGEGIGGGDEIPAPVPVPGEGEEDEDHKQDDHAGLDHEPGGGEQDDQLSVECQHCSRIGQRCTRRPQSVFLRRRLPCLEVCRVVDCFGCEAKVGRRYEAIQVRKDGTPSFQAKEDGTPNFQAREGVTPTPILQASEDVTPTLQAREDGVSEDKDQIPRFPGDFFSSDEDAYEDLEEYDGTDQEPTYLSSDEEDEDLVDVPPPAVQPVRAEDGGTVRSALDTFYRFKRGSPLKDYLFDQTKVKKNVYSLAEILTILKETISGEKLFDEHNPSVILCSRPLEKALNKKALHVTEVREQVLIQLEDVPLDEEEGWEVIPSDVKPVRADEGGTVWTSHNEGTWTAAGGGVTVQTTADSGRADTGRRVTARTPLLVEDDSHWGFELQCRDGREALVDVLKESGQLEEQEMQDQEGEYQGLVCHVPPDGTSQSVRAVDEERPHNPRNLACYMEAVREGYAGLCRADQQQGHGEGQERDKDQSLLSHTGPEDLDDLTLEGET